MREALSNIVKQAAGATVIGVSKKQSVAKIRQAYEAGQTDFGENFVQEFLEKHEALSDLNISWHFIGRLQTNKVKKTVGKCEWIHSVDSIHLAEKINSVAEQNQITQKILLQVNIANEATKGGFSEVEVRSNLKELFLMKGVQVRGLMVMPPPVDKPEESKLYFNKAYELLKELQHIYSQPQIDQLSMGTSQDFAIASMCGATMVRVGTVLFGERL